MHSARRIAAGVVRRVRRLQARAFAIGRLRHRPRYDFWTAYAEVLDGETLWVAVAGDVEKTSRLALRSVDSGDVTQMHTDVEVDGEEQLLISRFPLLTSAGPLPAHDGEEFDLVVHHGVDGEQGAPRPVGLRARPQKPGPTRTPSSRDHSWKFTLRPGPRRQARLACTKLEPTAIVQSISVSADSLHVSFTVPSARHEVNGLRVASEESEHAWVAVTKSSDRYHADIAVGDLQVPSGVTARLVAVDTDGDLALYRHHNDLKDPKAAVAMPTLRVPGCSESIRLFFRPNGTLAARRTSGGDDQ